MKRSFKNITSTGLLVFGLLFISNVYAQPGFHDDVDDENPAAPIDGLLVTGLIAGSILGYKKLKK